MAIKNAREEVSTVKAVIKETYGTGNVTVKEIPKPKIRENEVLIRVHYAGICGTDLHILLDDSYPIKPPVTLGHELSGEIAELGSEVCGYRIGDKVVSETYYYTCGTCHYCKTGRKNLCEERLSIGSGVNGAMAEYVAVPAENLHPVSEKISYEEASLTEPLACCVQAVFEHGSLQPGETVLFTGPGTIGLLTLQVARLFGCRMLVIGTKKDEERLKLARHFGAEQTLYAEDPDIWEKIKEFTNGIGADAAFECSGAAPAVTMCLDALKKGGRYVQVGIPQAPVSIDLGKLVLREYRMEGTFAQKPVWWDKALELMEQGMVDLKPLISGIYPVRDWEQGFQSAKNGDGFKHLLAPGRK